MQKALARLWKMYEDINNMKMEHEIKHVVVILNLNKEKKMEKTYTTHKADVNKCVNETARGCWKLSII
jgi:subtilisin-like proprotein convertase family protein